jgi:hypothetical protein
MGSSAALAPKARVRARLTSWERHEFDGVTRCTSVENRATLDQHNVGADELTMAVADASGWSSLER